jgi:hypothetical protein
VDNKNNIIVKVRPVWRSGGNTRQLRKRSRVRFPSVLGLGVYMYNMYAFKEKHVNKYVFIRYLESITQAL